VCVALFYRDLVFGFVVCYAATQLALVKDSKLFCAAPPSLLALIMANEIKDEVKKRKKRQENGRNVTSFQGMASVASDMGSL